MSSIILLLSPLAFNEGFNIYAQEQQQQLQQPNAGSMVNSICQLVRDNGLIAGLVGLDQALFICNNLNSIGSNQALSQLCSTIGGLNVINIDSFCSKQQAQAPTQSQSPNGINGTANTQGGPDNSQGNTQSPPSNSIIDRILGILFGFL
ncbi:MAG TPA: hypothetical protein VD815_10735 [Candidatus Saccharimonadales bacterium]|nr:hypothetical protein [Candidatus Saccharimonadales bacterium]